MGGDRGTTGHPLCTTQACVRDTVGWFQTTAIKLVIIFLLDEGLAFKLLKNTHNHTSVKHNKTRYAYTVKSQLAKESY